MNKGGIERTRLTKYAEIGGVKQKGPVEKPLSALYRYGAINEVCVRVEHTTT